MVETCRIAAYTRISVDTELDRDNTSIENQKAIIQDYVNQRFPGSSLVFYEDRDRSGYTFEQLFEDRDKDHRGELLEITDYLIDGPFILEQKDWAIKFRGSSNQRYIDCKKSLESGCAIETEP